MGTGAALISTKEIMHKYNIDSVFGGVLNSTYINFLKLRLNFATNVQFIINTQFCNLADLVMMHMQT